MSESGRCRRTCALASGTAATTARTRWTGSGSTWTPSWGRSTPRPSGPTWPSARAACEEYDVDVVVKTLVRARLPGGGAGRRCALRIHEQLTVMRVTLD